MDGASARPPSSGGPSPALWVGIDLGTTNTAAAVFDGERIEAVRTTDGGTLTPSVVRIDARGKVTVGARARGHLDADPENTRSEFKRLMGTSTALRFPAAGVERRPEELAAEVLRSVRVDVREQFGVEPARAVLTVPALFELPQASATSEAARLAGFDQVELLQEPVASAMAAGWSSSDSGGSWLVYDLGGGTFDVSLLETREGLLRVIGHDGDNFLGGRDIDLALVGWVLDALAAQGHRIDRALPANAAPLRALRTAAERAKIDLTRVGQADVSVPALFGANGRVEPQDLEIDRETLERCVAPIVDRSVAVVRRLLAQHGLVSGELERVVLVGGPTVMPFLRDRLRDALGAPFAEGIDPMSLVARGGALYAASAGLDGRPAPAAPKQASRKLWLQYPAMTADLSPFVAGRLLDGPGPAPAEVRLVRAEGGIATDWVRLGNDGGFVAMLELAARKSNVFTVEARTPKQVPVPIEPRSIVVVHGMSVGEPPLSRSVGLALANDAVQVYLARGTPLPAKRTFVHRTVNAVAPGSGDVVSIPVVQGEVGRAHLCRLVGRLVISASSLAAPLPAGSEVEVTLEVDRGGRLWARALILRTDQAFEEVAHLQIPDADPNELAVHLRGLRTRLADQRARGTSPTPEVTDQLVDVMWALQDAEEALADPVDPDAHQKARRRMLEAETVLARIEDLGVWPELDQRSLRVMAWASDWVARLGTVQEQRMLEQAGVAVERARAARDPAELERHLGVARQLRTAAYYRHPDAWRWEFEAAASDTSRATDLPRARELVVEGRAAVESGDRDRIRKVVQELWRLLPGDVDPGERGHASSLR